MQCPNCGATNPAAAQWCGQCLTRFEAATTSASRGSASGSSTAPADRAAPDAKRDAGTAKGNFRRRGDELEWACPRCGDFNSIDVQYCAVCQTPFVEQFQAETVEPPRNWTQAMILSAVVPGAGHIAVGRYGSGWARMVLFVAWAVGAVMLGAGAGARAFVAISPLLLGVAIVWFGSIVDLFRLQEGRDELLAGRRLLWLVVGILMLLGVSLFASLAPATG